MIPASTHQVFDRDAVPLEKTRPLKVWADSALVGVMVAVAIVGAVLL